ncbi:DNA N-6-adenine-methyltransferase [Nostoc phage YongM]|nr:DNA N-6-adenine-methyltransferase [Nostoc phage YongM]
MIGFLLSVISWILSVYFFTAFIFFVCLEGLFIFANEYKDFPFWEAHLKLLSISLQWPKILLNAFMDGEI